MRADAPVSITMRLPRDVASLRLVRAVAAEALAAWGAAEHCRHDVAVALTEACTNVSRHAEQAKSFEVSVTVTTDGVCTVEVTDQGNGFVLNGQPVLPPATTLRGRGLYLIAQLAEQVEVDSQPGKGTKVRFVKRLETCSLISSTVAGGWWNRPTRHPGSIEPQHPHRLFAGRPAAGYGLLSSLRFWAGPASSTHAKRRHGSAMMSAPMVSR